MFIFHNSLNPNAAEWTVSMGPRLEQGSEVFQTTTGILNITMSNKAGSNVALLELAEPIRYSDYVQPVCMDLSGTRAFPPGTQCWVAGWGHGSKNGGDCSVDLDSKLLFSFSLSRAGRLIEFESKSFILFYRMMQKHINRQMDFHFN